MVRSKILVGLLGLSLLALASGAAAREPAPDAYPGPASDYRAPAVIWSEMLAVRDEIELLTAEEELEQVADRALALPPLRREMYGAVQHHLGIRSPEEERDPEKKEARAQMIASKRALNYMLVIAGQLAGSAKRGIPGDVRDAAADLNVYLVYIESVLTDALGAALSADTPAGEGPAGEGPAATP